MRRAISALPALGLAVAAGPTNAQTVISGYPVETVITQPVQTVQTTETVRTIRHGARAVERKRVVTTTRVVSQRMVAPQPLYDVVPPVPPAPVVPGTYPAPLYDVVAPAPAPTVDETVINVAPPPIGAAIPVYRYVYESDRILVVDPVTNIVIQAIPR